MVTKLTYGSGLGEGISSFGASIGKALKERTERKQLEDILNPPEVQQQQMPDLTQDEGFQEKFMSMIQNYQDKTGEQLNPQQLDMAFNAQLQQAQQAQEETQTKVAGAPQYNMQQLAAIARKNPQLASMLQQNQLAQQKMGQQGEAAQSKRAFEENKPYYEKIRKQRETLPDQQVASMRIKDAMNQGNIKSLRNMLADYYDSDYLRSAPLNELNSAVKEFFLADVQKMPSGTRLNQFIEKNLFGALQSGGKTEASNQKISEYQNFKIDISDKELEVHDRLRDQYARAGREPPAGFERDVAKIMKPYVDLKQKELSKTYKDINEGKYKSKQVLDLESAKLLIKNEPPQPGFTWMLSPEGEAKQVPTNMVQQAQQSGGSLIR